MNAKRRINLLKSHLSTGGKNLLDKNKLKISDEVARALRLGGPVVALESTIITHGMEYPQNKDTALAV